VVISKKAPANPKADGCNGIFMEQPIANEYPRGPYDLPNPQLQLCLDLWYSTTEALGHVEQGKELDKAAAYLKRGLNILDMLRQDIRAKEK
jgi:hypothetical protein